ncbi:protein SHORT-ROOT-like [Nymphaea colorata]|uniref:Uncharacterized protein n=1 Tax=Nymphaea colorata TaxID=210225 RepID=A0A5K1CPI6_9MAGN|nr:protein SHORT-ROOT-like [Nymphaea colorata]
MDTLFRLVSFPTEPQTSFTTTTTTTTNSGATTNTTISSFHQECCNPPFMDDDDADFSSPSSSNKHFLPYQTDSHQVFDPIPTDYHPPIPHEFTSSTHPPPNWAATLLADCAQAVAVNDSARIQQLLWLLNELSSPYGDTDQKLAAYFLQALFARITGSGQRTHRTLCAAAEKGLSFESTRRTMLKFQEASPWVTFGHAAANGAILEAFDGEPRLHIVDISTTHCTQWPTLLEALATRSDDTPHLRLTTLVLADAAGGSATNVMREISQRIEKFARLMGVPFKFSVVYCGEGGLSEDVLSRVEIEHGEAVAVNCVGALRRVPPGPGRDALIAGFRRLGPKIVTVVEEEADFFGSEEGQFMAAFLECARFFSTYLESLDGSFPRTSNERLALERAAGRAIVDVVSCPASESAERRERGVGWTRRLGCAGFSPAAFSDEVSDDVRALLRRYKDGWSMVPAGDSPGIFLAWKERPVVWASAWKP